MTGINELERYDRQIRIWGEEGQRRISEAKVTIVGSGDLAKYTAMPLTALGIGQLRLLGSRQEGVLLDIPIERSYVEALNKLNPNVNLCSLPIDLESRLSWEFLCGSDVIVDTTNNPRSKSLVLEYAAKKDIPVITASVASSYAKAMLWMLGDELEVEHLMPNFEGAEPNPMISLLWGGVIAEEVKNSF
jgi:molybdopterin/thiamine biosynthesis adenylyltransferase